MRRVDLVACAVGAVGGFALAVTAGRSLMWGVFGAVAGLALGLTTRADR